MVAIGPAHYRRDARRFPHHRRALPHRALRGEPAGAARTISLWYTDFFGAQTHAVLPYSPVPVARFPAYLQQLCMESNGKSVTRDGAPVDVATGEIVWGEPGTNGQHAFYQLLHQGTVLVPADFLAFAQPNHDLDGMHDLFLANFLAQPRALAFGRTAEEVAAEGTADDVVPHKVMPGNHPSNAIVAPKLTPNTLGQLVAAYEHRVFTQGVVWGINSFDQWGVELGKVMARSSRRSCRASRRRSTTPTPRRTPWSGCCGRAAAGPPDGRGTPSLVEPGRHEPHDHAVHQRRPVRRPPPPRRR